MAKVISTGYTDTAIAGNPVLNLVRGSVNFQADFRTKSNNGKEVVLTNLTSPIDRPEKFRISYSEIANVYSGSGIDQSVYAPSKKGVSILAQVTEVLSVTDSTDAEFRNDLPMTAYLVIKVPSSEYVTSATVQTLVGRLLSGLYDTGKTDLARLDSILRGSIAIPGL